MTSRRPVRTVWRNERASRAILAIVAGGLAVLGVALAWRYTALAEVVTSERIRDLLAGAQGAPWAVFVVVAVFVLAGAVVFPLNMLILATAAVFGPWLGILYGGAGTMSSGLVMYFVGSRLGRELLDRMLGERWKRILIGVRKRGLLAVLTFRVLPLAPFTLVNLAAGASGIRFLDFFFGTLIGMIPGLVLMSIMGDRIVAILSNPSAMDIAILLLCVAVLIGLAVVAQALLSRHADDRKPN
jgi:phospholipase D1/2